MIDRDLLGPGDFIQVRAALVKKVGLAEAVVLSRIAFRTDGNYRHAYEHNGEWWWRAPSDVIAKETGLTPKQARRALESLRTEGHVIAEQHQREGRYDRAFSYRIAFRDIHSPSGADEDAPQRADDSSVKTSKTPPLPPQGDSGSRSGSERHRRGYPPHENEPNALRALVSIRSKYGLPLIATELLGFCYETGLGDPWKGYMQLVPTLSQPITDVNDPAAVLRYRLDRIEPEPPSTEPPPCQHASVEETGYCSFCGADTRTPDA